MFNTTPVRKTDSESKASRMQNKQTEPRKQPLAGMLMRLACRPAWGPARACQKPLFSLRKGTGFAAAFCGRLRAHPHRGGPYYRARLPKPPASPHSVRAVRPVGLIFCSLPAANDELRPLATAPAYATAGLGAPAARLRLPFKHGPSTRCQLAYPARLASPAVAATSTHTETAGKYQLSSFCVGQP